MGSNYKEWCDTADCTVDEVERRANQCVEDGGFPTLIFISTDLYKELQMSLSGQMRYVAPPAQPAAMQSIMSIMTSAGHLNIQRVNKLRNFLMVGRKEDLDAFTQNGVDPVFWNDQERARINQEFEDIVISGVEE